MRIVLVLTFLILGASPAWAQSVTYQGQLQRNGAPFTDTVAMEFRLYDALTEGTQVGSVITKPTQSVIDGVFQVELDFGSAAFDGTSRYLEVVVGGTTLTPRQAITAAPVAVYALAGTQGPQGDPGPQGPRGIAGGDLPAGTLVMFAGDNPPEGFLLADGSAISRATYTDLFSAISTAYGPGDGATTFNLPDLRQRFPRGATGPVGSTGGQSMVTLTQNQMPSHTHNVVDYGHSHGFTVSKTNDIGTLDGMPQGASEEVVTYDQSVDESSSNIALDGAGRSEPFSVMNPYIEVNYIIKY